MYVAKPGAVRLRHLVGRRACGKCPITGTRRNVGISREVTLAYVAAMHQFTTLIFLATEMRSSA